MEQKKSLYTRLCCFLKKRKERRAYEKRCEELRLFLQRLDRYGGDFFKDGEGKSDEKQRESACKHG